MTEYQAYTAREIQESISIKTDLGQAATEQIAPCRYDVTGAGDTAIAAFSAAVASGQTWIAAPNSPT